MITKRIVSLASSPLVYKHLPFPCPPPHPRCLHTTVPRLATPLPITATGPPPAAPQPAASHYGERVDRRRRQAELLKRGQDMRASQTKPGTAIKKRFWKDVSVQTDEGMTQSQCAQLRRCLLQRCQRKQSCLTSLIICREQLHSQPRHPRSSQSYDQEAPYHSPFKAISRNSTSSRMGSPCLRPAGYPLPSHPTNLYQRSRPCPRP